MQIQKRKELKFDRQIKKMSLHFSVKNYLRFIIFAFFKYNLWRKTGKVAAFKVLKQIR